MGVLALLLVVLTVSGHSHVLQPRLTVTQIAGLDGEHQSERKGEQLRDVSAAVERGKREEEQRREGLTPETRDIGELLEISEDGEERLTSEVFPQTLGEETKTGDFDTDERLDNFKKSDHEEKPRQGIEEEERESKLVAGISLHEGEKKAADGEKEEKEGNEERETEEKIKTHNDSIDREKEDHMIVNNLTPPLSASSQEFRIPAAQIITQSQNPPTSPPPPLHHHHNVSPSFLITPTKNPPVSPQFFPPSVELPDPTTISHISVSAATSGEVKSVLLLEDLLTEVFQSPGHHLKQNELEVTPSLEDVMVKNILFEPAEKELPATREIKTAVEAKEAEIIPDVQAMPKPTKAKFRANDLKTEGPNSTPKSSENNLTAKLNTPQPTTKPQTVKLMENKTNPLTKVPLTTAKTPAARPTKINRNSKNKTVKKSKDKKRKKNNKTQKAAGKKKEATTPAYFPYFKDNYCPPECACYGRVVQCSDKGVDKIPYGIPYNARYILLMNNLIDSIQLDLLNEYVSMEFLVLSNNRLTDASVEGAFEGIPALKRLYLDRNLLKSVPTDLPLSLEELRLDNNQLGVMSEAAWARCPNLLVLSLSNNSLGNGSDSLPDKVLAPLSNLRTLNLDHNQLTSVPLGLPLSIKELYLKGNLIEQFRDGAFDGISELQVLDLSSNRLTNKGLLRDSLVNATHLESLNLEGNRLKQVPRYLPRSLKTLNLEGNLISSIKKAALNTLKNLELLGLARNKIFKVAPGAFKALPVLHQLDLCHNKLRQVPRQLPQALHSVALTHNKIQSVPRDAFCWGEKSLSGLVRVQLENNLIDMGKLDAQAFRCLRGFQVVHFY